MKTKGIYVCLNVVPSIELRNLVLTGIPSDKFHITLMYAVGEYDNIFEVENYLNDVLFTKGLPNDMQLIGFESLGKDVDDRAIVALIKSDDLIVIHNELKDKFNLKHSFDDFKAHMTITYGNTDREADTMVKCLNSMIWNNIIFEPIGFKVSTIE